MKLDRGLHCAGSRVARDDPEAKARKESGGRGRQERDGVEVFSARAPDHLPDEGLSNSLPAGLRGDGHRAKQSILSISLQGHAAKERIAAQDEGKASNVFFRSYEG